MKAGSSCRTQDTVSSDLCNEIAFKKAPNIRLISTDFFRKPPVGYAAQYDELKKKKSPSKGVTWVLGNKQAG